MSDKKTEIVKQLGILGEKLKLVSLDYSQTAVKFSDVTGQITGVSGQLLSREQVGDYQQSLTNIVISLRPLLTSSEYDSLSSKLGFVVFFDDYSVTDGIFSEFSSVTNDLSRLYGNTNVSSSPPTGTKVTQCKVVTKIETNTQTDKNTGNKTTTNTASTDEKLEYKGGDQKVVSGKCETTTKEKRVTVENDQGVVVSDDCDFSCNLKETDLEVDGNIHTTISGDDVDDPAITYE